MRIATDRLRSTSWTRAPILKVGSARGSQGFGQADWAISAGRRCPLGREQSRDPQKRQMTNNATSDGGIASSLLSEILDWSKERPAWQRDALRRLFASGDLTVADFGELVEISKAAHGLAEPQGFEPLAKEHLAIADGIVLPVSVVSVTHHGGVNALAAGQTVQFSPALTIVYGENAAGKSGYIRILKQACRSRYNERIIGNVLSGTAPMTPHATITIREGTDESTFDWLPKAAPSEKLASVSIFDAHCVPVYLRDKTDVAFRPFSLDVFDKLSAACAEVRTVLEKERSLLSTPTTSLPQLPDGTTARKLLDSLTSLTSPESVRAMGALSQEERERLDELRRLNLDFQASDPKKLSKDLTLRADRIESLSRHMETVATALSSDSLLGLASSREAARRARESVESLREITMTPDLLPGTGGDQWKGMWDAAAAFSASAYQGRPFPDTGEHAKCVLCQQSFEGDAVLRMRHFAEYVASTAQAELRTAEDELSTARRRVLAVPIERSDLDLLIQEAALEDSAAATKVQAFIHAASAMQEVVKADEGKHTSGGVGDAPIGRLAEIAAALRQRAIALQGPSPRMRPEAERELRELEAREKLGEFAAVVLGEIERRKRLAAYAQCIEDAATNAITKKSTELTKRLVTDMLRDTFASELAAIEFTHLDVEVQPAGGSKGALFHRLAFTHAPSVNVMDVLSEGEARALSLAAFLTELSTAASHSTIVFDDPVSSLDHVWRERIARRLVKEASARQVVVFTHDLLFLHFLMAEAGRQVVPFTHQYIRRQAQAGICQADLPWIAMLAKERIGVLKARLQGADKTFRTIPERYEPEAREIYGLLREAWEQAVGEVLLNNVVERYRPSIETNRAKRLYDITQEDCEVLEREMSECSRWIRGHDAAPADATPIPEPEKVEERILALEKWVGAIRKRRQ